MTQLKKLIEEKSRFCCLPWIHAELNLQKNSVATCAKSTDTIGTLSDRVPVVWASQKYSDVRQSFLENTLPSACSACAVPAGIPSFREWRNASFAGNRYVYGDTDTLELPKSVTVILPSVSNVAPRTYERGESTVSNTLSLQSSKLQKFIPGYDAEPVSIDTLTGSFSNLSRVMICGGEPLMNPNIIPLIDMIVEEAGDSLQQLVIETNMSYRNIDLFEKLKSLSDKVAVSFTVNIDGPKKIHEYIRHGIVWEDMVDNMLFVSKEYSSIRFRALVHVSILNVGYIPETLEALNSIQKETHLSVKFIEVHSFEERVGHLNPSILPYNVKQQYLNKLVNFDFSGIALLEASAIVSRCKQILKSAPDYPMSSFYEYITAFDEATGTDYKTLYPELV
jgi:organic radical activating enzyme